MNNLKFNPNNAFKLFFQDKNWTLKTGIGGIINATAIIILFFSPVFIPISVCLFALNIGYILKCVNHKLAKKADLPDYDGFVDLLLSGLNWMALWFSYLLMFLFLSGMVLFTAICLNAFDIESRYFTFTASLTMFIIFLLWIKFQFIINFIIVDFAKTYKPSPIKSLKQLTLNFWRNPLIMLITFGLNTGIFYLAILIPGLSVFGIFLIPSTMYIASVINILLILDSYQGCAVEILQEGS